MTDVPGMTEFILEANCKLGLMHESVINRILSGNTLHPSTGNGIPRSELYLYRNDIENIVIRLVKAGAVEISPVTSRDWGDEAGYFADPDGHVIAISRKLWSLL